MRLIIALSTVAMIALSSSAMGFETAHLQITASDLTQPIQSLEVRRSAKAEAGQLTAAPGGRSGGFFGRIMELERRKQAWLRGMVR